MNASPRPVALVTGSSRGIGAATARALAARGYDVAVTYHNKAARAESIAAEVRALGGEALVVGGDLTYAEDRAALIAALAAWRPHLDALVLNASGGLEKIARGADSDYPMRINRDAQVALVDAALPLMPPGSVITLVTSHWATLYGRVPQLPAYEEVARSKHAGEEALRARIPDFTARGIRLLFVTGDVVEGTVTPRLLERVTPGLAAIRRAQTGELPTVESMAEAIAGATADPTLPSGHMVVAGGSLEDMLAAAAQPLDLPE